MNIYVKHKWSINNLFCVISINCNMDFQYPQGVCLEESIGTELVPFVKKFRYFTNHKDHNQNGPQGVGRQMKMNFDYFQVQWMSHRKVIICLVFKFHI